MKNLAHKIELFLDRKVDFINEVKLADEGDGIPYIKEWNAAENRPTDAELNALESQAQTISDNYAVRNTRSMAYGNIGDELDMLYKDILAGKVDSTGDFVKHIKAVKDANPKGE